MSMSAVPSAAATPPPPPPSRVLAMPPPPPAPLAPSAPDRRIDIQPAEDESDAADDSVSVKQVARARYMRNHFLADKLFGVGDTVPDTRQIVTDNKLRVLRRQVHSLTQFQSKLESELATMQEKHEERKRRFESSIATFEAEMKKHARKSIVVDEGMINKQVRTFPKPGSNHFSDNHIRFAARNFAPGPDPNGSCSLGGSKQTRRRCDAARSRQDGGERPDGDRDQRNRGSTPARRRGRSGRQCDADKRVTRDSHFQSFFYQLKSRYHRAALLILIVTQILVESGSIFNYGRGRSNE